MACVFNAPTGSTVRKRSDLGSLDIERGRGRFSWELGCTACPNRSGSPADSVTVGRMFFLTSPLRAMIVNGRERINALFFQHTWHALNGSPSKRTFMNTLEKVRILGAAGKWDVCASSASTRRMPSGDRIGDVAAGGICHSFTDGGRCVSLFKTLLTNDCSFDCKYCSNSTHCRKTAAEYEPQELAKVFMHLYLGNYVEGLFLSSAVAGDPDTTTEKMLDTVRILRQQHMFQGYIHFKVLPGTNRDLIVQAAEHADRLSINLEAPNRGRMAELSDVKDYNVDILRRQEWIKEADIPSGQTTQMVVGSSDETDKEILDAAAWEYEDMELRRVYYSAFTPLEKTPLEGKNRTPLEREHRLYCVDFMVRKYGIPFAEFDEILVDGNLPDGDPKMHLARQTLDGPVDVNTADYEELLRVPGIGPQSAQRILSMQKGMGIRSRSQLHSIGVVMKRADPFIRVNGRTQTTLAGCWA